MPREVASQSIAAPAIFIMTKVARGELNGAEGQETGALEAKRIVREEFGVVLWQETDLLVRRKRHAQKVKITRRLGQETTMSLKGIAQRLRRVVGLTYPTS